MVKDLENFPSYKFYKDSNLQWLGVVPWHWEITRLGGLFKERRTKVSDKDFPPLSVTKNGVLPQLESAAKTNDGDNRKLVKVGDFVINSRSDRKGSSGVSEMDGSVSLIYIALEPRGINRDFCQYLFKSYTFVEEFYRIGHGIVADLWTTRYDEMRSIVLALPPHNEQANIANFLDCNGALIDQAIQIKERQIERLKERKQILIQQAVTRGLNPSVPMKDSGVDWIDRIPAHWEVKPIMAVSDVIDPNPSHRNPEYVEEGFPFISTQEFYGFDEIEIDTPRRVSEKTVAEQEARCRFKRGSLVFSRKGTIGAVRVLPEGVRLGILDSLCVINPKGSALPNFLFWALSANYLEAQYGSTLRGAALPQLSVGRVRSLKIILPPKTEQEEISSYLRNECSRLSEALAIQERQIAALKEYKATLINSAVTGKIKVPGVVEPDTQDMEVA